MVDTSEFVLQALVKIKEGCINCHVKSGIIDNISGTIFLVQKIRNHGAPKTIGFFGAQKRGKSSLINQLLRCDLMPVGMIPMSSVVVKVKHEQAHDPKQFTIDVIDANGSIETHVVEDLSLAQMLLTQYGSHKGSMSNMIDTINVTSNFSDSEILENEGILVDTPGAEIAFDSNHATETNASDAQRAIKILSSTHNVIFVERADLMQGVNSKEFFSEHLKPMRPLSVINWKDAYNLDERHNITDPQLLEKKKQSCMREIMLKTYGVNLDRTLCVSSKEAAKARKNDDKELLTRSNVPELERRILAELRNLNPKIGLETCLRELQKTLMQLDTETAKQVFLQAQRPFYVMLVMIKNSGMDNTNIAKIARKIYEQYC